MQAVVLDSNALLLPFQFRVNLEPELRRLLGDHEIFIPSPVMDELRGLAKSAREARGGLRLATRCRVLQVPGNADDAVLDAASQLKAGVVSNDGALLPRV